MPDTLAVPPYVTIEQAQNAIRELVPDLAGNPVYEDCYNHEPFSAYYKFAVAETHERFTVHCYTGLIRTWELAGSHHAIPPAELEGNQEAYERRLINAYFPVPAAEMTRDGDGVWRRQLPNNVVAESQMCAILWSEDSTRVEYFGRVYSPIAVPTKPRLSYAKGLAIARRAVADALRVDAAGIEETFDLETCSLSVDCTGVQTLKYFYLLELPRDRDWGELAPWVGYYDVFVAVDARDGIVACIPAFGEKARDVREAMRLRDLALSPRSYAHAVSYQPRLIGGEWYMCWLYLDSTGWPGKLSVREHRGRHIHEVRYRGRRYSLVPGEARIQTAAGDIALTAPPLMLGEKLWVPLDAIEHITGWSVRPHHKRPWIMLTPPDPWIPRETISDEQTDRS